MKTFFFAALLLFPILTLGAPEGDPPAGAHKAPNGQFFPAHWGAPPRLQTRDLRPLPGGYGRGSGTLAKWIAGELAADQANPNRGKKGGGAGGKVAALKKTRAKAVGEVERLEDGLTKTLFQTEADRDAYLAKIAAAKETVAKLDAEIAGAEAGAAKLGKHDRVRAEIAGKEAEVAKIRDFLTRARLTQEGLAAKKAEIAKLEKEIEVLRGSLSKGGE